MTDMLVTGGEIFVAGLGAIVLGYTAMYSFHKIQKLDQSAAETQMTETTSPGTTQQK